MGLMSWLLGYLGKLICCGAVYGGYPETPWLETDQCVVNVGTMLSQLTHVIAHFLKLSGTCLAMLVSACA